MMLVTDRVTKKPRNTTRVAPYPGAFAFTIPDGCLMVGIGKTTAYKLASEGKLKFIKVGGRTLIDGDSLRSLLRGAA